MTTIDTTNLARGLAQVRALREAAHNPTGWEVEDHGEYVADPSLSAAQNTVAALMHDEATITDQGGTGNVAHFCLATDARFAAAASAMADLLDAYAARLSEVEAQASELRRGLLAMERAAEARDWRAMSMLPDVVQPVADAVVLAARTEAHDLRVRLSQAVAAAGTTSDTLLDVEAERDRLAAEAQRLRDLVRHQRQELHAAGLLSDEEYAALAADGGAVARLEGYDRLAAELAEARRIIEDMGANYNRLAVVNAGLQGKVQRAWAGLARLPGGCCPNIECMEPVSDASRATCAFCGAALAWQEDPDGT